ncbi:hypothetical protein PFICI_12774 [Pestalotiopsis fici W106-1]|uniref:AAA+ ATPase domain-containing protein n=1 Tax=Pestalotiopsis fici (strain W106-1 / CGMCC3.15140) TaxID=1229662 RepID=W3WPK3_PESFW|nr:uncharacterized protein PFICI_12774 [Pestalotiopsis fici W106-1]ETS75830.1 hypothetical protein PFICI_12774 [Pestalotiopsis fici W106-1]
MASSATLEVSPKDEGSRATNSKDPTVVTPSDSSSLGASAAAKDQKTENIKANGDNGNKIHKLAKSSKKNSKSKKRKKVIVLDDQSSHDSSESESSSQESSDTESDEEIVKNKSRSKKGKIGKQSRHRRKQSKSGRSDTGTEVSDSDSLDTTDEEESKNDRKSQKALATVQQQLKLLTRQFQDLARASAPGINNFGGMPLYNGGLATNAGINQPLLPNMNTFSGRPYATPPPAIPARGPGHPIRGHRVNRDIDEIGSDEENDNWDPFQSRSPSRTKSKDKNGQRRHVLEFKRVDQVWDSTTHNYKLQDTATDAHNSRYDEYLFHVRRTFDWEGKYKATVVDIKSKQLREALRDVMGNLRGMNLVVENPKLDPNILFLYLDDLREHMVNLTDLEPAGKTRKARKKVQKWIDEKRRHLRVLIRYLDKDYAQTKKTLYPLLEHGLITFDLCWALWKPGTKAYTTTYGSTDEPRVFNIEFAEKQRNVLKGEFFYVEGKYLEFDGKSFGYGTMCEEIAAFRGARKISSLDCFPLQYHKDEGQIRRSLIERGQKFVSLAGAHYKSHKGIAFYKKKKAVVKVNINGRVMIDPSTYRRNNPNYQISPIRPRDHDILDSPEDSEDEEYSDGDTGDGAKALQDNEDLIKYVTKVIQDKDGNTQEISVSKDELDLMNAALENGFFSGQGADDAKDKASKENKMENHHTTKKASHGREFSDEDYLIASSVVLGFAFNEKLWVELSVSGVKEISWNESAYESLVLQPKTKDVVKALVESHKYHAAENIDDVIQGKGKGLVFVLHGPPGTGKTLTAEGISEFLKCPLYSVSAGDLGTDSRGLEAELQRVLDICHTWGAILLLDEADVFLEKRNMLDLHRNALVSIFLRHLEYFQGIMFLTTNRVETFDDAFQSRIHIGLRYDELDTKAKKAIFKIFIERVKALQEVPITNFTDEDYNTLARQSLNGRQIKNTVRTAQALALHRGEALSMKHISQFLDVLQSFQQDLRGGTGYQDAMRSYF